MRKKYVELIKEYVNSKPDYKDTFKEIRMQLLTIGATEEEINEGFRQMGIPDAIADPLKNILPAEVKQNSSDKSSGSNKNLKLFTRLLEIDIVAHSLIFILLLGAVTYFFFQISPNIEFSQKTVSPTPMAKNSEGIEANSPSILQQIYANSEIMDAKKIFSFPKSNVTLNISGTPKKEVMGFLPYWMLSVEDKIILSSLTSVSLFALEVDGRGNIIIQRDSTEDPGWEMWNDPKLDKFINRAKRKRLKVFLTIKAFNNTNIEKISLSEKAQETFISNALHLINAKSLNGINIDFEYTGTPDKKVRDGFTRFVENLSVSLKQEFPNTYLSIDTYITSASVQKLFDLPALENYVDAFVIMGYDIHTRQGEPGPVSPLEGDMGILGFMQSYLEKIDPSKLILAVPYYGYDWSVPANADYSKALPYAEIIATSKKNTILWDENSQTPWYKYIDQETDTQREVHFENTRSLGIKYDFVNNKDLRGIGVWALGYEGSNTDLHLLILDKFGK